MYLLNGNRMKLTIVGVAAAIVLGGGSANADFTFGRPTNLGPPFSSRNDGVPNISSDDLEFYFSSDGLGGYGSVDIWVSKRLRKEDPWGEPVNLGPINTQYWEAAGPISSDGLEFYFVSDRPGGAGGEDMWVTRRESIEDSWGVPENLGPVVNSSHNDACWSLSDDGLELYFFSMRSGGGDIYVARRATKNEPWQKPVILSAAVNSSGFDGFPLILKGGLMLLLSDHPNVGRRPDGYGGGDIWMTTRATRHDDWNVPINLGPKINSTAYEGSPTVSPDGSTLYFASRRPGWLGGTWGDSYQAPIIPIVDFNGDCQVNIEDLLILIEHWGQNEPAYDMGPMPWGDGVVDKADLEVLMRYWGQKVDDPTLRAFWKLDETEGDVAYDSAALNDAAVLGEATWAPTDGMIGGALLFDGIDDYIEAPRILNPGEGAFSVFAWVKGDAPGQVIVSQQAGANWLSTDNQGCLVTDLKSGGRLSGGPLISETTVTDGNWHRVGFTWDGTDRVLYVDDVEVARDTLTGLQESNGDLYIGAGSKLEEGSFWSGMIDDVWIYDRVVIP